MFIDKKSWLLQMIVWRDGCNKDNPFEIYILTKLHYGLDCDAATMSKIGLDLITSYGESNCTSCNGKYIVNNQHPTPTYTAQTFLTSSRTSATSFMLTTVCFRLNQKKKPKLGTTYGDELLGNSTQR